MTKDLLFSGRAFGAFLFDMDGTILTSIAAAERVWGDWARRHGVDVASFLPTIHGMRASETIRRLGLPGIDIEAEADAVALAEFHDVDGIEPISGAAAFLASLPRDRWALVTSAPRRLAMRRLEAAGLPEPPLMVCGEDVRHGKPAPECFLLGAQKLGQRPQDCLVFEDAPAGIAAGVAAGATITVVTATHQHPHGTSLHAIPHYDDLTVRTTDAGHLTIARVSRLEPAVAGA